MSILDRYPGSDKKICQKLKKLFIGLVGGQDYGKTDLAVARYSCSGF
jgi:hypothetical protein